jgi:hypothetical protein
MSSTLARSSALWNRSHLDLESDEILGQILDRGSLDDWRELYRLASGDVVLRRRLGSLLGRVPIGFPGFWRAAMASLGEPIDWSVPLPVDTGA